MPLRDQDNSKNSSNSSRRKKNHKIPFLVIYCQRKVNKMSLLVSRNNRFDNSLKAPKQRVLVKQNSKEIKQTKKESSKHQDSSSSNSKIKKIIIKNQMEYSTQRSLNLL